MNDNQIEQEIQDKGLTAPRVTPADIEAAIDSEVYFTAQHGVEGAMSRLELHARHPGGGAPAGSLGLLTFCVLVLRNGFTVVGESACVSPENFDAELGRDIARKNAVAKIWPLMGYELKERLFKESRGDTNTLESLQQEARLKLVHELMEILGTDDAGRIVEIVRDLKGS